MHIVLTKHWNGYKPGKVFPDMPDGSANLLLRRNLATRVAVAAPDDQQCMVPAKSLDLSVKVETHSHQASQQNERRRKRKR